MKNNSSYIKHIYWLEESEEALLREELEEQGTKIRSAKGVVCTPLDEFNKVSSVAPHVWNEMCARQGSWYRASNKNGLHLVVSSFDLQGYRNKKSSIITRSDFSPPRRATMSEKDELIHDQEFMKKMPSEWMEATDEERRIFMRWARKAGSGKDDYQTLFISHSANHSNFINPLLYINDSRDIIPYSIDRSSRLCSCCLEMFQIIGESYKKKLVAPCPGATLFARLEQNNFLLVEKVDN